ncbi:hypothetical protein [Actinomadura rayongensis]|uniref:Uncharacterized protein n=1 Tax=Actinomadura rayongensis TaxID=1429076 RepID=A0A6I4WCH7_9ACTN|nr:hypothetical protein [Actinomadura rayongensis]MXQ64452.1 hypothetical protein [Actinomadura rayongensis]
MARPLLRAVDEAGHAVDDPTRDALHDLLADMTLRNRFVILERRDREPADQHYMQAYLNDDMTYQVEYREGSADKHFQAHYAPRPFEMFGPGPIAEAMLAWAHDREGWQEAMPWHPKQN